MHKDHNHKFEECLQSMPISLNCYVYNFSASQPVCVCYIQENRIWLHPQAPWPPGTDSDPSICPPLSSCLCVFCGSREMGIKRPTWAQSAALHVPGDSLGLPKDLTPLSLGSQAQVRFIKTGLQRQQVALFSSPITPLFARWHPVCFGRVRWTRARRSLYVCGPVFPPTSLLKASSDRARNDKLTVSSCFESNANVPCSWSYSLQRPTYVWPFVSQTDDDREAALTFVASEGACSLT